MRYIKLSISLIVSALGLLVYFVTIPKVDENEFVNLSVLAGNEALLDDYYFNGYVYDYGYYHLTNEDILIPNTLPYLQKLDATGDIEMMLLENDYPEYAKALVNASVVSVSEDYLTSTYFNYDYDSFTEMYGQLNLSILNKETKKVVEETIQRDNVSDALYANIEGIYENYPEVHILVNTISYINSEDYLEESELSLISYNIETKNSSEKALATKEGYINATLFNQVQQNKPLQLFKSYDSESENEQNYLVNYAEGELMTFDSDGGQYFISDDNRIYRINGNVLFEYDKTGQNIINERLLATDYKNGRENLFDYAQPSILDGKLFIMSNDFNNIQQNNAEIKPSHVLIYDLTSGEILTEAQVDFSGTKQVDASDASVDFIGKRPSQD